MPKAITKNIVFVCNEPISLIERINILKETREKYKNMCKRCPLTKPKKFVFHTHPAHPDSLECTIAHIIKQAVDSAIVMCQYRLEDCIPNSVPLFNRISDPHPLSERIEDYREEMSQQYPALPKVDFKKFREDHIKEFKKILTPVIDQLMPFYVWLDTDNAITQMTEEEDIRLWDWFSKLQDIELHLDVIGYQWKKSKPWRDLRGACKAIEMSISKTSAVEK